MAARSRRLRRGRSAPSAWVVLALVAFVLLVGGASGIFGDDLWNRTDAPQAALPEPLPDSARALLAELPVKGRAPKTGYDRDLRFGDGWLDVDRNGCDTRNDVLARDLGDLLRSGPCKVMKGTLLSPYTGEVVDFVRGQDTSSMVQIDHVVALSDAWQKGAQQLDQAEREVFANDPLNLLAVDGASNSQKSDSDAATWLPADRTFRCEYVARQVSVKARYELWVTQAERDAMERVLATCPEQPALG